MNIIDLNTDRSWIEIDLDAIDNNVKQLLKLMKDKKQMMAVIKADAYGHGDIMIARELQTLGIDSFAVATLKEAIALREANIHGDILILGFTAPYLAEFLNHYQLTQTVIDYQYACQLNEQHQDISIHIKVDSGMHRLGEDYHHISHIEKIYKLPYLHVKGIFSHLCVADSSHKEDILFTHKQFEHFDSVIKKLKDKKYDVGKTHIQSSYGLINYSQFQYDYFRIGISLYGVKSSSHDNMINSLSLIPALSIKSRIACIHHFKKNLTIGYGRDYTLQRASKIAVAPIGYADGLPRHLLHEHYVLIHGQKAPIVGRLCMDQILIDVTDIENVKSEDVVTIIGQDGNNMSTVEELADNAQTITNEILSRIGQRLPKLYKKKGQYINEVK